MPAAVVAVAWGVLVIVTAWPRRAVYNPVPPFHWALQWGPILFAGSVLTIGGLWHRFVSGTGSASWPEHAAVTTVVTMPSRPVAAGSPTGVPVLAEGEAIS